MNFSLLASLHSRCYYDILALPESFMYYHLPDNEKYFYINLYYYGIENYATFSL